MDVRLATAEADYAANLSCRDANTHIVREKDKEKIRIELRTDKGLLTDKDGDKMKDLLLGCVKEVTATLAQRLCSAPTGALPCTLCAIRNP